jgi:DNA repair exonuclease SbcCD ATPase subunit
MIPSKDEQSALVHEAGGGAEAAGRPATGDAGGGASIDKVRDLLFGGQLRELDRRFARLEERLVKETNQLRQDMQARIDALEAYARKESDSLGDQIRAEHQDRVDAHDNLARDLKESSKSQERRTTALDEQTSKAQRELRQQMLEQHQRLSEEIRRRTEDLLATLTRESQALRADKTDRSTLAALLNEMAMRLTDELRVPGAEDGGNG